MPTPIPVIHSGTGSYPVHGLGDHVQARVGQPLRQEVRLVEPAAPVQPATG